MYKTIGHQTIGIKNESVEDRKNLGPIKSIIRKDKEKRIPFAGEGYYFWDNNLIAANWWGDKHYKNKGKGGYRIFKIDLELNYNDSTFFDLVGNMEHLYILQGYIRELKQILPRHKWLFHHYIATLRSLERQKKIKFPYKILRFLDYTVNAEEINKVPMRDNSHFINSQPFYAFCMFELNSININTYKFVKEVK